MPAFISMILGGLISITGSLVGRVLLALGLGVATYTGITTSVGYLKDQAVAHLGNVSAEIVGMMAFLKVGEAISIVVSATLARALINGVQSDTVKKWVIR